MNKTCTYLWSKSVLRLAHNGAGYNAEKISAITFTNNFWAIEQLSDYLLNAFIKETIIFKYNIKKRYFHCCTIAEISILKNTIENAYFRS